MKKNTKNKHWLIRNLLLAATLIAGTLLLAQIILTIATRHFDSHTVPDFTGLTLKEARELAKRDGIVPEVNDSIYVKKVKKGSVIHQNPAPGSKVKRGRRILLTINATTVQKAPMPNLIGYSLRSAKAELASRGFELGRLRYVSDMATDNVLEQLCGGVPVKPGKVISCESVIDLVLGLNSADACTSVPSLVGIKFKEAVDLIHENSLNVGNLSFDAGIHTYQDSLNAMVWSQYPEEYTSGVTLGRNVSLKLTLDEEKVAQGRSKRDYIRAVRAREQLETNDETPVE